jgi:Spy/CpxP family protein refolding chaperone
LKLTEEQQIKILAIKQNFEKESRPLRFAIQIKQLELRQLWGDNPLNQKAIESKDKELIAVRIKLITLSREMSIKSNLS